MTTPLSGTVTVCLFAESRLVREALSKILDQENGIRLSFSSCFSSEALKRFADIVPHVVLLDSDSFCSHGIQIIDAVHKEIPKARLVMLNMQDDTETFLRTVRAGIAGYVLREASAAEVVAAIGSVTQGEAVCPAKLCLVLFDYMARQGAQIPGLLGKVEFGLTRREQQLVLMISRGLTNKEIAGELNLSDQTVKHHVHQILGKVGVPDRMSAAEVCRLRGMLA
ncbi:MAG TPA: response regulator transcription factor [Terriglobales bacterium]|nr:response regulator transcription factor [Terriglobales bacterium]